MSVFIFMFLFRALMLFLLLLFFLLLFFRSTFIMAAVSSTADLAAPSKRSRGLADIDPKFVSNVS
jgi:hypothetical protein